MRLYGKWMIRFRHEFLYKKHFDLIGNGGTIRAIGGCLWLKKINIFFVPYLTQADLYYQHRIDPKVPVEEVAGVMADLMKEGKIIRWGLSEADEDTIRRAHKVCLVTAVQNRYSMMARWHEKLFPVLEELNIGYVAFSPLANGFLSARYDKNTEFDGAYDYRSTMPQFTSEGIDQNHELLKLLHQTAKEKNATPAQISLAWMLCKNPYLVPIPGTRKAERLKENADASEVILTASEVKALDDALDAMEMSEVFGGSKVIQK